MIVLFVYALIALQKACYTLALAALKTSIMYMHLLPFFDPSFDSEKKR
jgi:hypothetical protein